MTIHEKILRYFLSGSRKFNWKLDFNSQETTVPYYFDIQYFTTFQIPGCTGHAITDVQGLMGEQYKPHNHQADKKAADRLRLNHK